MGHVTFLAKKSFNKIFKNLADELGEDVNNVLIGICYENGEQKYEAYKKTDTGFERLKNIDLNDYCGMVLDLSGGTSAIDATIASSGPRFAKEVSEKTGKEIGVDDIEILMRYNNGEIPKAVLMADNKKQRDINIEQEFLQGG